MENKLIPLTVEEISEIQKSLIVKISPFQGFGNDEGMCWYDTNCAKISGDISSNNYKDSDVFGLIDEPKDEEICGSTLTKTTRGFEVWKDEEAWKDNDNPDNSMIHDTLPDAIVQFKSICNL